MPRAVNWRRAASASPGPTCRHSCCCRRRLARLRHGIG